MRHSLLLFLVLLLMSASAPLACGQQQSPLLQAMKTELDRSFDALQHADEIPLYYLSYHVTETEEHALRFMYGALSREGRRLDRILGIDCRVGNHTLDNTHEIRGEYDYSSMAGRDPELPLSDDEIALRTVIWNATDKAYKAALERYTKVLTNQQVLVEREDTSADFCYEKPEVHVGERAAAACAVADWTPRLARLSGIFKEYPFVLESDLGLRLTNDNRYFVDSDGALIQTGQSYARLSISCTGTAVDGMRIDRHETFDAATPAGFPDDTVIEESILRLISELKELLNAPLAEPYTGPAILVNRAAGVFFHEIFGHRIEGHRQKSESEGQTFARKVGQQILPEFISVYDDPTLDEFEGTFLRGHYDIDDEGVRTTPVTVVENGILKNFLMSRTPIAGFSHSNAHGRKQAGRKVVSRQGNLIIKSSKQYPFEELKEMMLAECRQQGKPYGLVFVDISGGFTQTGRYGPQSFKVLPLLVYRYYTDGREPEVIRGVDIVGTPLASFAKISATGNDYGIFNGTCGAESGWVPVAGVSPSVLVSEVEVEKKMKEQEKPPILDPPYQPTKPDGTF